MLQFTNSNRIMKSGDYFKNKAFLLFAAFCISAASVFAQDIITLKNGEDIEAIVQEISDTEIKYKKMENPNGPNYTLRKAEIFMIRYANGSRDVFVDNTAEAPTAAPVQPTAQSQPVVQNQRPHQSQAFSQTEMPIVALSNGVVRNGYGSKMSKSEVRELIKANPAALATYDSGLSQKRTSNGLAISGLILGGTGLILAFTVDYENNTMIFTSIGCMLAGTALLIPSIILMHSGSRKIVNAVDMYNNSIHERNRNTSLNFGITRSGGVGLVLNF